MSRGDIRLSGTGACFKEKRHGLQVGKWGVNLAKVTINCLRNIHGDVLLALAYHLQQNTLTIRITSHIFFDGPYMVVCIYGRNATGCNQKLVRMIEGRLLFHNTTGN